ncbi:MAG: 50S ribosomal protein L10 [bacterium]
MTSAEAQITHEEELAQLEREPRPRKVAEVARLKKVLEGSKGVFLTDFRGLDVAKMNELRSRFREEGVQYKVVKNTLLMRAADDAGLEGWLDGLEGPVAMAVGRDDPVAPAKIIDTFREDHKREGDYLLFQGGILNGEPIDESTFHRLASLPGREELIAQVLYLLTYPMRGLVTVLSGVPRSLVYALEDLRKKRESGEIEGPAEEAAPAEGEEERSGKTGETPEEEAEKEEAEETAGEAEDEGEEEKAEAEEEEQEAAAEESADEAAGEEAAEEEEK